MRDDIGGPYDLILCRDTLFHLPLSDAIRVLRRLDLTGSKLLVSHYDEQLAHNWPDIPAGGWHSINLLAPPFNLPPPIAILSETGGTGTSQAGLHYGQSRKLGLWRLPVMSSRRPACPPGGLTGSGPAGPDQVPLSSGKGRNGQWSNFHSLPHLCVVPPLLPMVLCLFPPSNGLVVLPSNTRVSTNSLALSLPSFQLSCVG